MASGSIVYVARNSHGAGCTSVHTTATTAVQAIEEAVRAKYPSATFTYSHSHGIHQQRIDFVSDIASCNEPGCITAHVERTNAAGAFQFRVCFATVRRYEVQQ